MSVRETLRERVGALSAEEAAEALRLHTEREDPMARASWGSRRTISPER